MITPMEYKDRYENIAVPLKGGGEKAVKVNMYRLRSMPASSYGGYNEKTMQAFMEKLNKNGINIKLRVDTDAGTVYLDPAQDEAEAAYKKRTGIDVSMKIESADGTVRMDRSAGGSLPFRGASPSKNEGANDMHSLARYVFAGKGAPEHCQMVLQLAHHWGLAPDPQVYADDAMGLDCNGFIGNYLWHGKAGKSWTDLGIRNRDLGPDATIDSYFPSHPQGFVASWDDLDGSKMYVMGMVDANGNIIRGGGGLASAGHFMITQPNFVRPPRKNGKVSSRSIFVVESTAGHKPGLWESFYSLKNAGKNRVFTVLREEMTVQSLDVKIAEVK